LDEIVCFYILVSGFAFCCWSAGILVSNQTLKGMNVKKISDELKARKEKERGEAQARAYPGTEEDRIAGQKALQRAIERRKAEKARTAGKGGQYPEA
jgi:hypothetical protein